MTQTKEEPEQFDFCEDEIKNLAEELITNYHPSICEAKIAYLWNSKEMKRSGQTVIGKAKKCSKDVKAISSYDFIITLSFPTWNTLTDKQKKAALDHELTHCSIDITGEEPKVEIVPHDVEEFLEIIDRHNLYKEDLVALGRIVKKKLNGVQDSKDEK